MIDKKCKPYVYRLEHKDTGQFYYGVRMVNKVPAHEDLFVHYFSSSKTIEKMGRENFLYEVVQEFDDRNSALAFEDRMIRTTASDQLSLNKARTSPEGKFYFYNEGRTFSEEHRRKISEAGIGKHSNNGANRPEVKEKNRAAQLGKKMSPESIAKRSASRRGVKRDPEIFAKKAETQRLKNGGHYFSEDARRKISEARKARSNA